jgi:NRAMP (natural resistance-associated macrophage protein)-like metal ion transporter
MNAPRKSEKQNSTSRIKKFFSQLGPGLVTGASDDDPSGIATYSQAGAQFGPKFLWTAIATYPLMVSIQEMCARIGLVTNKGLAGVIKQKYSRWVLYLILIVSYPSITLNIGADIAGMGAVGNLLFPTIPSFVFSILFTGILIYSIIFWNYHKIASILKWLCITLFSYILIPFLIKTDWSLVLKGTFLPTFDHTKDYFMALVGILGTTISPYLFFWQASMEVEEVRERRLVVDKRTLHHMQSDVKGGMLLTNIVFYFIILTSGTVLFNAGIHQIDTVEQAAQALRPLAGDMAYALFSIGVIGTGFLAIPVLAGASSYMVAEIFNWDEGLDKKFHEAKGFYISIIISLVIGLMIQLFGISPVKALLWSAVLYGITAPILIAVILHLCNSKKVMGQFTNRPLSNILGFTTLIIMLSAAIALIWFLI